MRKLITTSIVLLVTHMMFAQKWTPQEYQNWNQSNFRNCQLFHQKFNQHDPDYQLLNAALFYLTNDTRLKYRKPVLAYHAALEIAAYNHSYHMAESTFFSHENNIDARRRKTDDRGKLAGIVNPYIAENIVYFINSNSYSYLDIAIEALDIWMNSPGHRSNILAENGVQFGCGVYVKDNMVYGTQNFQWYEPIVMSAKQPVDQLPNTK
jgi:uncharacterized protein YkwD